MAVLGAEIDAYAAAMATLRPLLEDLVRERRVEPETAAKILTGVRGLVEAQFDRIWKLERAREGQLQVQRGLIHILRRRFTGGA